MDRAALQLPTHRKFYLFRHIRETGVNEYRIENFRGDTVASVINPKPPFMTWVRLRMVELMKEVEDDA